MEEEHRDATGPVVRIHQDPAITPAADRVRHCPRCLTPALERKIPRLGSVIEFDCCPRCKGYWLDYGALEKLLEENRYFTPGKTGKRIFVNLKVVRYIHTVKIKKLPARA